MPSRHPKPEECAREAEAFQNLFTGLDLSGWKSSGAAREHWQPRDWMLHHDGKGTALFTEKEFGDAEFIVDFRFPKKDGKPAHCALAIRESQGEGSVGVSLAADGKMAVVAPGVELSRECKDLRPDGQWNRLRVSLRGTALQLTVNGKVPMEARLSVAPRKGAFGLLSLEEMDFGNLFVREIQK